MLKFILPLGLVVVSNIIYQICAKSSPKNLNPFALLTVTYAVGAVMAAILFCFFSKNTTLFQEYKKLNWVPFVLGIVIVGLEVGWIFAYKAGWQVSTAQIVQSAVLAVFLIIVGAVFYKEPMTWNKIVGVLVCLVGLVLINFKF